jgi:hypothetical protein
MSIEQNSDDRVLGAAPARRSISLAPTVPLFAATLFLSALLLFWMQPLFAKMLLPLLGGSPGVWNTAMVCFQAMLLAGYLYAHLSTRWLAPRQQVLLHLGLLAFAALALPIAIRGGWPPPTESSPIPWLIAVLGISIGMPFFTISATAPLLQRWFSATGHPASADPYFLYGASNFGSILALLAYPTLLEPLFPLAGQSWLWTAGYLLLALLIVACGVAFLSTQSASRPLHATCPLDDPQSAIGWRERARWIVLAAVPSSLLLGVTAEITSDVAAVPLLWVLPLTLYLLTFVIVFARRPVLPHRRLMPVFPYALAFVAICPVLGTPTAIKLPAHLLLLFTAAMICHGELARHRPNPQRLTDFYFCMSLGGVAGGIFSAILAPIIFNGVYEYPIALVLTCLLLPRPQGQRSFAWRDLFLPTALALPIFAVLLFQDVIGQRFGQIAISLPFLLVAIATCGFRRRPIQLALGMALLLISVQCVNSIGRIVDQERGFFGVVKLQLWREGRLLLMVHGVTTHGAEYVDAARWREPLLYYHPAAPVGQLLTALPEQPERIKRVAVVGLGTGALDCFAKPGQSWTFFEIDPLVVRLARDTNYFHFLEQCGGDTRVVPGDGRLSLRAEPDHSFDVIVLDAFSSDSIPTHLLTREALVLYFGKLREHGIIVYHISNNFLALAPVLSALAADADAVAWRQFYHAPDGDPDQTSSDWVALARNADDLAFLATDPRWQQLKSDSTTRPWTDDYSNLLGAIKH